MIYHFTRHIEFVADLGVVRAIVGFESAAFYTFLLSLGIAASQICDRRPGISAGWLRRLIDLLRVVSFFSIVNIFDAEAQLDRTHSLWDRFSFLFHLFGVDRWM